MYLLHGCILNFNIGRGRRRRWGKRSRLWPKGEQNCAGLPLPHTRVGVDETDPLFTCSYLGNITSSASSPSSSYWKDKWKCEWEKVSKHRLLTPTIWTLKCITKTWAEMLSVLSVTKLCASYRLQHLPTLSLQTLYYPYKCCHEHKSSGCFMTMTSK